MKGKFSDRVTPLMTSAMNIAWSSLSITHGPAMRNNPPAPMRTLSIWKDALMADQRGPRETQGKNSQTGISRPAEVVLSPGHFLRPVKHFHFGSRLVRSPFQSVFI